jgi:hypothetical protein
MSVPVNEGGSRVLINLLVLLFLLEVRIL